MSAPPKTTSPTSPTSPRGQAYKGVGTLLKHWGNSEVATVEEKQMKICESSGLESLVNLARMPHVKVQSLAMAVISSLVEAENGDISIDSEDGFRPLVDLTKFPEDDVQKEAVWALAILASNSSCQARIEHEVGWHNFRKFASSTVPEIQAGTAILLGNLALEKKNQEAMMAKGVPILLTMLSETKDAKVRRAVVTALSNVSIIEGYGAKDIWLEKGIELMMPYIEQGDDTQLQIGALNTIANVCNHDKAAELKRKVAQLGGIGRLVPLLNSADEMIVKLAAMTVANMASEDHHRNVMHGLHIEEPLIRLLDSRDEEVQLGVTMAINALSDHEGTRKGFHSRNAAEALKELIYATKDRDIAKEAKEALSKVAPEIYAALDFKGIRSDSDDSYSSSSEGTYSDDDDDKDGGKSDEESDSRESGSESDSDSALSDGSADKKKKSLALQKEEEQRLAEQRKAKEEQQRKRLELINEEDKALEAGEKRKSTEAGPSGAREENGRKESKRKILVADGADTVLVDADDAEEELKLQRRDGKVDETADAGKVEGESKEAAPAEEPKPELTEEEKQRLAEEEKERLKQEEEAYKKQMEVETRRREEQERVRRIEEEAFRQREEVETKRKAENDELALVDAAARQDIAKKLRSRTASIDSFVIPKNPAKNLVHLLRDAKNKKGVTREALRELEKFASRREREQLQFGEDIIAILVYITYFYNEEEHAELLILTLYLLAILARYHVKNQMAIRRARGGEQLVKLLVSNIEGIKRNSALALGAYALNNKSVQNEVSRAIPLLVRTLEILQTPATTLRTVAACLASLADSNSANQDLIIQNGGIRATVTLMAVDKHFVRSCLHLLSAMVSHNQTAQNLVIHEHGPLLTDLLTKLTAPEYLDYRDSISNALVELIKKNPRVQRAFYTMGGIGKVVPLLDEFNVEDDRRKLKVSANVVFLLYSLLRNRKFTDKARADCVRLRVVDKIKVMCAHRSPNLAELSMNLTKAIEARR